MLRARHAVKLSERIRAALLGPAGDRVPYDFWTHMPESITTRIGSPH